MAGGRGGWRVPAPGDRRVAPRMGGTAAPMVADVSSPATDVMDLPLGLACPTVEDCMIVNDHADLTQQLQSSGGLAIVEGESLWTSDGGSTFSAHLSLSARLPLGVSCPDASTCYTVGALFDEPTQQFVGGFAAVSSNAGASWTDSYSESDHMLFGISCPSVTGCTSVGVIGDPHSLLSLSSEFASTSDTSEILTTSDGSTWSSETAPTQDVGLINVSCPTTLACVAVGMSVENDPIAVTGDGGTNWQPEAVPVGQLDLFTRVSCSSATDCVAVGQYANLDPATLVSGFTALDLGFFPAPLEGGQVLGIGGLPIAATPIAFVTTDGGQTWQVSSPISGVNVLTGVSCGGNPDVLCIRALVDFNNLSATPVILESTDGGLDWNQITLPDPATPARLSILFAMTCLTDSHCFAVGSALNVDTSTSPGTGYGSAIMLETTDGGLSWNYTDLPLAPGNAGTPTSIDCAFECVGCSSTSQHASLAARFLPRLHRPH